MTKTEHSCSGRGRTTLDRVGCFQRGDFFRGEAEFGQDFVGVGAARGRGRWDPGGGAAGLRIGPGGRGSGRAIG